MNEDPGKVIARLRTATLPRLADVMTVCDELESRLSTVPSTKPAAVVSIRLWYLLSARYARDRAKLKRRAMAKWRKSRLTPSPSRQARAQAR
jgi:hypothetical protein